MANKRKLATAAVAVTAAAAMLLSGTFAWQSISQTALNEASDVINPGGRLHDDFNGENKDIYVENFADEKIFARVRLSEYMEFVMNYNTDVENRETVLGGEDDEGNRTYTRFYFDGNVDENGVVSAGNHDGTSYWSWQTGGQTVYMPTFNLNKDSLKADINGIYEDGNIGTISDRILDMTDENAQYSAYTEYAEGDTTTGDEIYDADANDIDDEGITTVSGVEHTAKSTLGATLMSMQEWIYNGSNPGEYWVYDTDGWVYWAQAIEPDTATGLLLDSIELSQVMDDTWYYAIHVEAQFVTADDVGKSDGTGFYVDGTEPSADAEDLLRTIGVTSVDDEPGEGGFVPEPQSPLQLSISADPNWYIESSVAKEVTLTASATYESTAIEDVSAVSWSISGNSEEGTALSTQTGASVTLTIAPYEAGDITVTASYTYTDEEQGIEETATEVVDVTNGPRIATMWVFDNAENEPEGFYADSTYTPGTAKTFNLTTYFFPNYTGTVQPISAAYSGEAAELLAQKYTCTLAEEYEGVTLTQDGANMTVTIDETATAAIQIQCELEDSHLLTYDIQPKAADTPDDGETASLEIKANDGYTVGAYDGDIDYSITRAIGDTNAFYLSAEDLSGATYAVYTGEAQWDDMDNITINWYDQTCADITVNESGELTLNTTSSKYYKIVVTYSDGTEEAVSVAFYKDYLVLSGITEDNLEHDVRDQECSITLPEAYSDLLNENSFGVHVRIWDADEDAEGVTVSAPDIQDTTYTWTVTFGDTAERNIAYEIDIIPQGDLAEYFNTCTVQFVVGVENI